MPEHMLYARKLYDQELGYRKGVPKKAGRYFYVSKDAIGFFPPLSTSVKNDHVIVNLIPPFTEKIVLTDYVYHNDKIVDQKPGGRNEFRLYLNSENDPGGDFFKPGDVVLLDGYKADGEIVYKVYHFPLSKKGAKYAAIDQFIRKSDMRGLHALIPAAKMPFIKPEGPTLRHVKVIPVEVAEEVLKEPLQPLPTEILQAEFEFTNIIRENVFRDLLLYFYDYQCAVTGTVIRYKDLMNLQAAHIIPEQYGGPTHPRNGLPLSRDLHWAFDMGFFTLSESYEVIVHKNVADNPSMQEIDGRRILLPEDKRAWPSLEAIKWHSDRVFGIFSSKSDISTMRDIESAGAVRKAMGSKNTLDQFLGGKE